MVIFVITQKCCYESIVFAQKEEPIRHIRTFQLLFRERTIDISSPNASIHRARTAQFKWDNVIIMLVIASTVNRLAPFREFTWQPFPINTWKSVKGACVGSRNDNFLTTLKLAPRSLESTPIGYSLRWVDVGEAPICTIKEKGKWAFEELADSTER